MLSIVWSIYIAEESITRLQNAKDFILLLNLEKNTQRKILNWLNIFYLVEKIMRLTWKRFSFRL